MCVSLFFGSFLKCLSCKMHEVSVHFLMLQLPNIHFFILIRIHTYIYKHTPKHACINSFKFGFIQFVFHEYCILSIMIQKYYFKDSTWSTQFFVILPLLDL